MIRFWPPVVFRFAVVLTFSLLAGFTLGERWGLLVAIAGLLLLIGFHLWYLWRVVEWLDDSRPQRELDELPHGFGAWISVFRAIRRSRRRDEDVRSKLGAELARFIEASNAMPDGIVILDAADRLEWCNPRASEHFGLDPKRDQGFYVYNLIRRPVFTEYLVRRDFSEPIKLVDPANDRVLSVQLLPFQEMRRIIVSRDVSQLHRVEAMRQDFIANVSHELRTPLTVVAGFLEHLADNPEMDPAERDRIQTLMLEQSRRMRRLIDDLLTLARLETQIAPPADDEFALRDLIDEALAETRVLSGGKHTIHTDTDITPDLMLRGSRDELRSALENLLSNAVRYTPERGSITLAVTRSNAEIQIDITDTGPGIAAEHLPRVTERFFRVDKSRSRETGGTGLGLAIVKHVLARHGGHLEIASQEGRGSTFAMVLPNSRVIEPQPRSAPALAQH